VGAADVAVFAGTAWFDTADVPITGQRQAQRQGVQRAQFASMRMLPNGHFQATVVASAGQDYLIEVSTDLVAWQQLGTVEIGVNGQALFVDERAAAKRAFYRTVLVP
jgi:hypothetical protein